MTAARRFLRPICYQDWPQDSFPAPLRNMNPGAIPRRIKGALTTEDIPSEAA